MRSLNRQMYPLAWLATLTAIVLAACSSGPGVAAPTVKGGAPAVVVFDQGQTTRIVSLSSVFTGQNLTFSDPESSKPTVATASIANGILTIASVSPGEATITVTATNSRGSKEHKIAVTIPTPSGPTVRTGAPTSVEFDQGQTTRTVSLSSVFTGQSLTFSDPKSSKPTVATASIANGILTITAAGPGEATVTVTATNAGGTVTHEITVTVPATSGPAAPTVRAGAPTSVEFDQGQTTRSISLRGVVFTGENLVFDIVSDTPSVATASILSGILIITAGDPGEATITVTATNDSGNDTHRITVTVPEPEDGDSGDQTPQPSTTCRYPPAVRVTINLNRTKQCIIPKGHTLNPDSSGVSVREDPSDRTDTVWLVTAGTKGTHDITVHDGDGRPLAGKITVVVPNSLPYRNATSDPATAISLGTGTNHTAEDRSVTPDLHTYFTDPDAGDMAPFLYRIIDQPEWVLIETKDGFLVTDLTPTSPETTIKSATTALYMEVLNEMEGDSTFTVSLVANDGSDESELPVVLTFQADGDGLLPRMVPNYTSMQTENGALGETALKVGPRRGVEHTLTFGQYPGVSQFKFVADKEADLMAHNRIPGAFAVTTDNIYYKAGSIIRNNANADLPANTATEWVPGFNYFVLEALGAVEEPRWVGASLAAAGPQVTFKLKESGGSGSIKISYYVVYAVSNYPTPAKDATLDPATSATLIATKTLNVTVVTCSSPPDPVDDCP